jgi:hypothetical protein
MSTAASSRTSRATSRAAGAEAKGLAGSERWTSRRRNSGALYSSTDDLQGRYDIVNPKFDAHIQTLTVMLYGEHTDALYMDLFTRYKAGDKEVAFQRADNKLCKSHTFAPLFGGAGESEQERTYYKWFKAHYSGVTETQDAWDAEVQMTGRYIAPTGMEFNWDRRWTTDWRGRSRMVNHVGRSLYSIVRNLPIQYFATGELAMVSTLCLLYEAAGGSCAMSA